MFHPMILGHSEHDSYFNLDTVHLDDLKSGELEHARSGSAAWYFDRRTCASKL